MNQNRITNIIERGGVEGWETVSSNYIQILTYTIYMYPNYYNNDKKGKYMHSLMRCTNDLSFIL